MTDLIDYIRTVRWEDIKDLPEVNGRVYLNGDLEAQDRELKNSSYLYLTLFSEPREDDKDRYFGPDENNAEIANLSAQEGLADLQATRSSTNDALLFSASLTLWYLECFSSVN